jgi:hypothetical protein
MQIVNQESINIQYLVNMRDDLSTVITLLERILPNYNTIVYLSKLRGGSSTESDLPYSRLRIGQAAESFLQAAGTPQCLSAISLALQAGGVRHNSARLIGSVHSALRAKPDIFHRFARGSWGLSAWLKPPPGASPVVAAPQEV